MSAVRQPRVGDKVRIIEYPVGTTEGWVRQVRENVPHPFYLTANKDNIGKKDADDHSNLGPYSAEALEIIEAA